MRIRSSPLGVGVLLLLGGIPSGLAADLPRAATPEELAALSPDARRVWVALTSLDPPEVVPAVEVNDGFRQLLSEDDRKAIYRLRQDTGWDRYFRAVAERGRQTQRQRLIQDSVEYSPLGAVEFEPLDRLEAMIREAANTPRNGPVPHAVARQRALETMRHRYPGFDRRAAAGGSEARRLNREWEERTLQIEAIEEAPIAQSGKLSKGFIKKLKEEIGRVRARNEHGMRTLRPDGSLDYLRTELEVVNDQLYALSKKISAAEPDAATLLKVIARQKEIARVNQSVARSSGGRPLVPTRFPQAPRNIDSAVIAWEEMDPGHWSKMTDLQRPQLVTSWARSRQPPPPKTVDLGPQPFGNISREAQAAAESVELFQVTHGESDQEGGFYRGGDSREAAARRPVAPPLSNAMGAPLRPNEVQLTGSGISANAQKEIQIPTRDGYGLAGLSVTDKGVPVPYEVLQDPSRGTYWVKLPPSASMTVDIQARFSRSRGAPKGELPPALADMDGQKLLALCQELDEAGLNRLADRVKTFVLTRTGGGRKINVDDLTDVFRESAFYSYVPELAKTPARARGPFALYSRFLDEAGELCYQCSGASSLLSDFLTRYLGPGSEIEIALDRGYVEKSGALTRKGHQRLVARWKTKKWLLWGEKNRDRALDPTPVDRSSGESREEHTVRAVEPGSEEPAELRSERLRQEQLMDDLFHGMAERERAHEVARVRESVANLRRARESLMRNPALWKKYAQFPNDPLVKAFRASSTLLEYYGGEIPLQEAATRLGVQAVDSQALLSEAKKLFESEALRIDALGAAAQKSRRAPPGFSEERLHVARGLYSALEEHASCMAQALDRIPMHELR